MKTSLMTRFNNVWQKTTLFVVLLGLSSTLAFAENNLSEDPAPADTNPLKAVVFQVGNTMKFKAFVENPSEKELQVRILDENKKVIYEDRVTKTTTYIRKFDLSNLHDGVYTVEISNGEQSYTQHVELNTLTARVASVQ
jgi:hypothetical protein